VFLTFFILLASLCLTTVSAFFSIIGLTSIFPAAAISVIVMGIVFEIAKIASISFLHWHWKISPILIRSYLFVAIFILMFINSMGSFGYLSKAHIEQEVLNNSQTTQVEIVISKIDNEKSTIADIDKQIAQIDNALDKLTSSGRASTSLQQAQIQRKTRDTLVKQKTDHMTSLEDLNTQKINADASNAKVAADFGPLKYIADAIYGNPTPAQLENVVRWIIIIIIIVSDPLAVCLLVAAQFAWSNRRKGLTYTSLPDMLEIDNDKINNP